MRPHKEHCHSGNITGGTPEEGNERLARKARVIGANAIVIMSVHDKTTTDWLLDGPSYYPHGGYWPRYGPVRHSYRHVHARAIKISRMTAANPCLSHWQSVHFPMPAPFFAGVVLGVKWQERKTEFLCQ